MGEYYTYISLDYSLQSAIDMLVSPYPLAVFKSKYAARSLILCVLSVSKSIISSCANLTFYYHLTKRFTT